MEKSILINTPALLTAFVNRKHAGMTTAKVSTGQSGLHDEMCGFEHAIESLRREEDL